MKLRLVIRTSGFIVHLWHFIMANSEESKSDYPILLSNFCFLSSIYLNIPKFPRGHNAFSFFDYPPENGKVIDL